MRRFSGGLPALAFASALALGFTCVGDALAHAWKPGSTHHATPHASASTAALNLALQAIKTQIDFYRKTQDAKHLDSAYAQLAPWLKTKPHDARVWVMHATLEQIYHRFDPAIASLNRALALDARNAQAWLTLANLHRMAGRYSEAQAACQAVARSGAAMHALACESEMRSLRGAHEAAASGLHAALHRSTDREQRAWILSLLAEAHERAGHAADASQAYRQSLALARDPYTVVAYADQLFAQGLHAAADTLLRSAPDGDAVQLRKLRVLAHVTTRDDANLREQIAAFDTRLRSSGIDHDREAAYLALWVRSDAKAALPIALRNLRVQREPIDWLIAFAAATALKDDATLTRLREEMQSIGLADKRLGT